MSAGVGTGAGVGAGVSTAPVGAATVTTVRLAAGGSDRFALDEAARNRARGRDGWPAEPELTRVVVDRFTDVVGRIVAAAGLDAAALRETEIAVGTLYGMARVGEVMHEQLDEAGPKWLAPEMFVYYSPHSLVSAAAVAHGLGGAATTLLGRDGGMQALLHAVRRLSTGQADTVLVGAYEALTPFADAALDRLGVPHHAQFGDVAAVLLGREAAGAGAGRRLSVARGVASGRALPAVLDAAGVDPAAVADVRLCGATVAVQQAARAEFGAAFPRARTWVGGASSPAVGPVCALAEAVAPPADAGAETAAAEGEAAGRAVAVVAGRPGAWDVVLAG
ncbi:beta-ketoacyl synthase N-terminal-like domain-containing protein [Micromonospora sp. NPDC002575]|uniref:beta-ketoacyl synthase N-terminal-like domain-containing protein n=1 Tax=Micromonospora sp. NPDC002575 TaxID=3364222 RepID=UPI00367A5BB5